MTTTISKYKTNLIGIMLFFNSLIWNGQAAQPVFHLAGEAVYNENLVKETNRLTQKSIKTGGLSKKVSREAKTIINKKSTGETVRKTDIMKKIFNQ